MLSLYKMKEKLDRGEIALGSMICTREPTICEMYGRFGFDFLWIEAEHSPFSINDIQMHLIAASSGGVPAFVRVTKNDPDIVKPLIDMGADGIIFPNIRTVDEAKLAVASCTYPPAGDRGFGPKRCLGYGQMTEAEYLAKGGDTIWKILMVEHVDCVNNLDEICALPGVDALVIGFNDLSGSVGLLTQTKHPTVVSLMDRICEAGVRHGKPVGIVCFNPADVKDWIAKGLTWFAIGADSFYLESAKSSLANMRKEIGSNV